VQTWASFRAVLDLVRRQEEGFDYLVLSGDLAQDEAEKTYSMLREALGGWLDRCRIIPGNHDDRGHLRTVFPELFPNREGPLAFAQRCDGWWVIGLDSQIPGESGGRLDADQLGWLDAQLAMDPERPALLFVHHPPIPISVAWLDQIGLDGQVEFLELVKRSPQIKLICAGHVHQEFSGTVWGTEVYTTPSTCVQFAARNNRTFDTSSAGYRVIVLRQDGFHTAVHRLSERPASSLA